MAATPPFDGNDCHDGSHRVRHRMVAALEYDRPDASLDGSRNPVASVRLRRATAVVAALTATLGLSACGTSFDAQTNQQYQAAIGADLRTGPVLALNTLFVDNGDGTATLSTTFVNKSDEEQTLQGVLVAVGDEAPVMVEPASDVVVPVGVSRRVGEDGEIVVELDALSAGVYADAAFTFEPAGDIEIETPVVARSDIYDDVARTAQTGSSAE